MTFTPNPVPLSSAPDKISEVMNINFALLSESIKQLEDSIREARERSGQKSASLSVVGTTDQVTVSTAAGVATVSTPSPFIAPGNIEGVGQIGSQSPSTLTPSGTTETVDWDNGSSQVIDLGSATGNVTLTLSNPDNGFSYQIPFIQGATARSVVLPSAVLMSDGTSAPHTLVPNTTDNSVSVLTLTYYTGLSGYIATYDAGEFK